MPLRGRAWWCPVADGSMRVPLRAPFAACRAANDVWSTDFKGWFRTGDGARCEPLTIQDQASRYLIRAVPLARISGERVWAVLDAAFRAFRLPKATRSDNGAPFASTGAGGLSALAVRLIKAGVVPERIDPASPQLAMGRVVLLGDAAFVARPHVGAGVTKAALDAMCLADAIRSAGDDLTAALTDYDRHQRRLGDWCVARGRQMGARIRTRLPGEPEPSRAELDRRAAMSIRDYRETTEDIERLTVLQPAQADHP